MRGALTADVVAQAFPTLDSVVATGDASANQKSVFRVTLGGAELALKLVPILVDDSKLGAEASETVHARMRREVDILRNAASPHIPVLGSLGPGVVTLCGAHYAYFSEEFIHGSSLREVLSREVRLPVQEAARMGCNIADAIQRLHLQNQVHRDVKPANIMRRAESGDYVLIDPGYALDLSAPSLSKPLAIPGTLAYMSPEQTRLGMKRDLDLRSDFYALGVVMYEALSGVHPYLRPRMRDDELLEAIRTQRVTRPEGLAVSADGIWEPILRLLKKHPHQRFNTTLALVSALEPFMEEAVQ